MRIVLVAAVLLSFVPAVAAADLVVSQPVPVEQGISTVSVTDSDSGARFDVAFDAVSERAARDAIPVLAGIYAKVASLVDVDPARVDWSDVLFAKGASDLLLERKPGQVLWRIDVPADGILDAKALQALYVTIPHEQVHATQDGDYPRWYEEGQAEWAGLRVTAALKPELERMERDRLAAELAASTEPLALDAWGGMRPKLEAVLRQLTPAQRVQFKKDPGSVPLHALSFGPDDLISDESNTMARYAASLAVFEGIEAAAGPDTLQAWFRAVRAAGAHVDTTRLEALARETTGQDIAGALH